MGNKCSCSTYVESKQMTLNVEDFEHNQNITFIEEQFDNPQHNKLSTNFLQTNFDGLNKLNQLIILHNQTLPQQQETIKINLTEKESQDKTSLKTIQNFGELKDMSLLKIKQSIYSCSTLKSQKIVNFQDFIPSRKDNIRQKYEFLQKIGEGAYGKVYKAISFSSKQIRAIKIIKKSKIQKTLSEIKILKQCSHPNIIQLYQVFQEDSFIYVVTEYCKGGSVLSFMKNNSTKFSQIIIKKIMKQILETLVYLESIKIIHRDLKLQNMVFVEENVLDLEKDKINLNVKIIDFGGAMKMRYKINQQKRKVGTISYMAPEAFDGIYSSKTDVWCCGVVLYVLLRGKLPFQGRDYQNKKHNIKIQQLSFEGKQWEKVSTYAKQLVRKLLVKDYFKRPSASDCLDDIWFSQTIPKHTQIRKASFNLTKSISKYYAGNNFISVIESYISFIKISQEQKNELKKIFQILDKKKTGRIDVSDILRAFKLVEGQYDENQIRRTIQSIDKNNSGCIDFIEFQVAIYGKKKLFVEQSLIQAFDYFDVDKSGYIQKKQFFQLLSGCENLQINILLSNIDLNGDDRISKQQFLMYFRKFQKNLVLS